MWRLRSRFLSQNLSNRNTAALPISTASALAARLSSSTSTNAKEGIKVTYVSSDGKAERVCYGRSGQDLMRLAHANDVDLEGACEGACACSTCHVIIQDPVVYRRLPEPSDDENDMLDLAFGLTPTSRLGCQVKLTPDLDGLRVQLPSATRNMYVDGAKPKPH